MNDTCSPQASIFRPAGAGTARNALGTRHVDKVVPAETGGAFLLAEITVPPGCGAPMHRHHVDAECFYVLDGALTFTDPSGSFTATTGDTCFLPAMSAHAFRNDGEIPARVLVFTTPGRDAQRFFAEIDAAMGRETPDIDIVTEIARRHRITILPPAATS
jgi:mannose-6-phosphate isomerase-like protein (cupin superfamily)